MHHIAARTRRLDLRYSAWDLVLVALAIGHGALLIAVPAMPVIALGVWWNSNTISHNFIHKPFFRSRTLNMLFSFYLSLLLGIPQTIWRARHLAHHAETDWRLRITPQTFAEILLVAGLWATLAALEARFFLTVYLPGYVIGLVLCALHGHYEHAAGTTSHHGRLYNWLFFNDGFHVEHHLSPGTHWTQLAASARPGTHVSRWPAVLRWLDHFTLDSLEQLVLRSTCLQQFVLRCHERAFRRLMSELRGVRSVAIVGGGLFPRTAIILHRLMPELRLTVIDARLENLRIAESMLDPAVGRLHAFYDPDRHNRFDLVVIPLAFIGDRRAFYQSPTAPIMLVHDWVWRARGQSTVISWLLLKRLNLIRPRGVVARQFRGTIAPFVPILNRSSFLAGFSGGGASEKRRHGRGRGSHLGTPGGFC